VDLKAIALAGRILLSVDLYNGTWVCGRVIYLAIQALSSLVASISFI
jgi:hypothetical protein